MNKISTKTNTITNGSAVSGCPTFTPKFIKNTQISARLVVCYLRIWVVEHIDHVASTSSAEEFLLCLWTWVNPYPDHNPWTWLSVFQYRRHNDSFFPKNLSLDAINHIFFGKNYSCMAREVLLPLSEHVAGQTGELRRIGELPRLRSIV